MVQDAVEPDARQQQRDAGKEHRQRRQQPFANHLLPDERALQLDGRARERRACARVLRGASSRRQRQRIAARPHQERAAAPRLDAGRTPSARIGSRTS